MATPPLLPTDPSRLPKDMAKYLSDDQAKLYELIWKRMVASQMASAVKSAHYGANWQS